MNPQLTSPFLESAKNMINQMASVQIQESDSFQEQQDDIASYGVSALVTFAGVLKGRLLLDLEPSLAKEIVQQVMGETYDDMKDSTFMGMMGELSNIIGGDALTFLNNEQSYNLRLASPAVFIGKEMIISIPKIQSATIHCTSRHGNMRINVAFEKGGVA
ncbi:chemotaxis protein CheX [Anoxynatronum buryatiense]|uniref:Chemotaxis protein CheX n=1 Tax=Anoxynatronum buryatiense TaxID=489973 RepID=A0AA45WUP3_9CLOT|nr:chemotaxis protein CheX [Anoxynatronum buryatiense]SMP48103.1 chemotaxis protein CheX [Anoxynatronum buryatiense]